MARVGPQRHRGKNILCTHTHTHTLADIKTLFSSLRHITRTKCVTIGQFTVHPITWHESIDGASRYSSTLSFTTALDGGGGWFTVWPGRFISVMTRYPLYRGWVGPRGRSGRVRKISSPLRDSITGQSSP